MTTMTVLTPSYLRDLELFADLHDSVLRCMPESVVHHVVVPDRDVAAFARFRGARCQVWPLKQLIPRRFVTVPGMNSWVNVRHPWPPVRGWVMQQLAKLSLTAQLDADVVLLVDSDVLIARPVTAEKFMQGDRAALYREVGAIDDTMPRHMTWHSVARSLLGLPHESAPLDDYVNAMTAWDPSIVRELFAHVEAATGRPWIDALAAQLHFSEDILYGVFADGVLRGGEPRASRSSPCHCYWGTAPLDTDEAVDLACGLGPEDVAVLISSKSNTPLTVRRAAWAELHRFLLESA